MSQDMLDWLKACKTCQQTKPGDGRDNVPLAQEFINGPMLQIGMDITSQLVKTQRGNKQVYPGNSGLLLQVD